MQADFQRYLQSWRNPSLVQAIMLLLGMLVAIFFVGMLLLSHLNLKYSQEGMAELRRDQISDVVLTGLARIDARQIELQRHTMTLALLAETFHRLAVESHDRSLPVSDLKKQLERSLSDHIRDFGGADGAGIWFEPGVLSAAGQTYAPYFINTPDGPRKRVPAGRTGEHYREQPWFQHTLGPDWRPQDHLAGKTYWSAVYFDFEADRAVLTLARPIFSGARLIGMVTTDWDSAQIIDLVSRVEITDSSFSFLTDRNNRNLSSLSRSDDVLHTQRIIDAVLAERLPAELNDSPETSETAEAGALVPERLHVKELAVADDAYELHYASTPAGMVYGAGVPRNEIDQVLLPMRDTNYQILTITGSVLLILSLCLLYLILQLMQELQASYTDSLTRLPNRSRLLKDLQRRQGACLFIVNLDRFKEINSLFGTACGDRVLVSLADLLNGFTHRHSRTLNAAVYRLSGDEFALLGPALPESSMKEFATDLTELLRNHRVHWERQALSMDASAGIACRQAEDGRGSADQLLSQATIALLLARAQMRNYLIYDANQEVEKDYERNLYWAQRLKDALEQNRIVPHFQPIFDNRKGRVCKFECLARMIEGEHRVISAGQFLGIANKLRLNRQITRIMIEKSFARFLHEDYEFSINLSYSDLVEPEILQLLLGHLRASNIGHRVIFEILESDGIENYEDVLYFVEQVKPFGCQIAIDDFGTGYSNFAHLLQLNVDIIKIDGSLIQHLDEDPTAALVTKGIVQFARSLGIKTVAEFVHNGAVQDRVVDLGIDFSQGAYFSMPVAHLITEFHPGTIPLTSS
ncbi:bifunctional diguanylate cyclase/phosphodiesterase [Marinobacter salicampi]|uniref:bifunctional diguanylate cyclase/phosphodiesterase n=1 Tax=Marinobacter salicampi TaxID=435907 RepID=UPI001F5FEA1F|nr:EAL domain-containing protein [Marinobacter salicampi]